MGYDEDRQWELVKASSDCFYFTRAGSGVVRVEGGEVSEDGTSVEDWECAD